MRVGELSFVIRNARIGGYTTVVSISVVVVMGVV